MPVLGFAIVQRQPVFLGHRNVVACRRTGREFTRGTCANEESSKLHVSTWGRDVACGSIVLSAQTFSNSADHWHNNITTKTSRFA